MLAVMRLQASRLSVGSVNVLEVLYFNVYGGQQGDNEMIMDLQEIKGMLDRLIIYWRIQKEKAIAKNSIGGDIDKQTASCYIDAYQSVRKNIFDELLP